MQKRNSSGHLLSTLIFAVSIVFYVLAIFAIRQALRDPAYYPSAFFLMMDGVLFGAAAFFVRERIEKPRMERLHAMLEPGEENSFGEPDYVHLSDVMHTVPEVVKKVKKRSSVRRKAKSKSKKSSSRKKKNTSKRKKLRKKPKTKKKSVRKKK